MKGNSIFNQTKKFTERNEEALHMKKQYRFLLVKVIQYFPRLLQARKVIIITAHDAMTARQTILEQYPKWQVSMFWVVWP